MKKSIKMLAIMLSVLMIVSMLPAVGFASGTSAVPTTWEETFESYAEGTSITSDSAWTTNGNVSAAVTNLDGNNVLEIKSTAASSTSSAISAAVDISSKLETTDNFTVDFDFKYNTTNIKTSNYQTENFMSLTGGTDPKGAYLSIISPTAVDAAKGYTSHWAPSTATDYTTAVGGNTASVTVYPHRWNRARMICHTVTYGNNQTADYAEIYVNGTYLATLPYRFGSSNLTHLVIGLDKYDLGSGIYLDNIKATASELTLAKAASCDYEQYAFGPVGFNNMTVGSLTNSTGAAAKLIGNTAITSERISLPKNKTVTVMSGNYGKVTDDKYLNRTAASQDLQTNTEINKLAEGEQFEISFDYLPATEDLYFTQRITGSAQPHLLKINNKTIKLFEEGDVYYTGTSEKAGLNTDEWYRITYVVTGGNGKSTYNKASVYINGMPIAENVELKSYATVLSTKDSTNYGSASEFIQWQSSTRTDSFGTGNIDNLQIRVYRNGANFVAPVKAEAVSAGYGKRYTANMTLAQLETEYSLTNVDIAKYSFTDATGNAVTDKNTLAAGNYVTVTTTDGRKAYVKLVANSADSMNVIGIAGFTATYTNGTSAGIDIDYGKGTDNSAVKLATVEGSSSLSKFNPTMPGFVDAQTIEFNIFAENDSFNFNIAGRPTYTGVDTDWKGGFVLFQMNSKNIKIAQNAGLSESAEANMVKVDGYDIGEWIKVGMTIYPGSDKYVVRVNGQEYEGSFAKAIKANGYFECQIGKNTTSVILDDLRTYKGSLPYDKGEKAELDETTLGTGVILNGKSVSLPCKSTISAENFTSTVLGAEKVFVDSTTGVRTATPVSGNKLILVNDGIYTSYTVTARTNEITQVESSDDSKIKFILDKTAEGTPCIINAVFNENLLQSASLDRTFTFDTTTKEYIIDKPNDTTKKYILYLWDVNTLKPLSGSCTYSVE